MKKHKRYNPIYNKKTLNLIGGYNQEEDRKEREYIDGLIDSIRTESKEEEKPCYL